MSTNPPDPTQTRPGTLQSMLARLRGMVQSLQPAEPELRDEGPAAPPPDEAPAEVPPEPDPFAPDAAIEELPTVEEVLIPPAIEPVAEDTDAEEVAEAAPAAPAEP